MRTNPSWVLIALHGAFDVVLDLCLLSDAEGLMHFLSHTSMDQCIRRVNALGQVLHFAMNWRFRSCMCALVGPVRFVAC